MLTEPQQYSHHCDRRLANGIECDRVIGPYYDKSLLHEAVVRHTLSQHANSLPTMVRDERTNARIHNAAMESFHTEQGKRREARERRSRGHGTHYQ